MTTMSVTAPNSTCPSWCAVDERQDATTWPGCHPDDFTTWHNGTKRTLGPFTVELRLYDPDVQDEGESYEPTVYVEGVDEEGECSLILDVSVAGPLAAAILAAVEEARSHA